MKKKFAILGAGANWPDFFRVVCGTRVTPAQVEGLLREVDPAESKWKLKEDSVLLMLKKVKEGEEWDTVTRVSPSFPTLAELD